MTDPRQPLVTTVKWRLQSLSDVGLSIFSREELTLMTNWVSMRGWKNTVIMDSQ
jgi:hypothetical protein